MASIHCRAHRALASSTTGVVYNIIEVDKSYLRYWSVLLDYCCRHNILTVNICRYKEVYMSSGFATDELTNVK